MIAARRHADHVVDLDLAAGADAEIALDAGVELHRHRRMAAVGRRRAHAAESGCRSTPSSSAHCQRREFGSCAAAREGWSPTSSSNTILRENRARSLAVCTFMPGAGLRTQEAASTRSPSISTMQARQLPSAR